MRYQAPVLDKNFRAAKAKARDDAAGSRQLDPGIAAYFVWMRRQTGLSIHHTAAILHTEAYVIDALEAGDLAGLPAWPETVRIVQAYAGLAGADAAGPLNALYTRWPTSPPRPARRTVETADSAKSRRIKAAMTARNATRPVFKLW
ncbi:MAG: hypothetical protein K2Y05_05250 [Hyphomicrobiaceae bacterium]|nr:hypothetical protein [Hyphomicrobiaceae bacterium]